MSKHGYEAGRLNLPFVGLCSFGKFPYQPDWGSIDADFAITARLLRILCAAWSIPTHLNARNANKVHDVNTFMRVPVSSPTFFGLQELPRGRRPPAARDRERQRRPGRVGGALRGHVGAGPAAPDLRVREDLGPHGAPLRFFQPGVRTNCFLALIIF